MELTSEHHEIIEHYRPSCTNKHCIARYQELADILLEALASPEITALEDTGEQHRLHPTSIHIRSIYQLVHRDGRAFRLAFTHLSTIQIFSKRNRRSHCYPPEFAQRLTDFMGGKGGHHRTSDRIPESET